MDLSATAMAIVFAFLIPFIIYFLILNQRKAGKKRLPPEAPGSWPVVGHLRLLSGSQPPHIILGNLADKIGSIFTIKLGVHRALVVSNVEAAKECVTTNDKAFASRPKGLALEILGYNYSMLGFSPYGSYWRQMRKIVTIELLSNHRLEMLKHVREAEVKEAIQWLYQQSVLESKLRPDHKLVTDVKMWFWNITMNVIFKIIVARRYTEYGNSNQSGEGGAWTEAMRDFMVLSGEFVPSDFLPFIRMLDLGGVERAMKKTAKDLDAVVQEWLEEHKQKKADGKGVEDFMEVLLSIVNGAKELSSRSADTITKSTCLALILAASDTTAITLTWTLSLLLNSPDALRKAQQELDIHVGRERQVKESDMKDLVYLQAVIKESFRLYPAVPLSLPHESMEDCTVGGYHIPAGTRLLMNIPKIHRDPSVWSHPHEFQPERFLTTHKDVDVKGQNFELIPFGSGRRMCPGASFALQVLNLTLASMLHGFEIETPFGEPVDMTETSGITNVKATPLEAILTPRLPAYLY